MSQQVKEGKICKSIINLLSWRQFHWIPWPHFQSLFCLWCSRHVDKKFPHLRPMPMPWSLPYFVFLNTTTIYHFRPILTMLYHKLTLLLRHISSIFIVYICTAHALQTESEERPKENQGNWTQVEATLEMTTNPFSFTISVSYNMFCLVNIILGFERCVGGFLDKG